MNPITRNNFIVITGGPGAGKTTLIRELEQRGYRCIEEVARRLIAEQLEAGGDALPWQDKERYKQLMFDRSVAAYRDTPDEDKPVFFDRGLPDTLCYAALEGLQISDEMKVLAAGLRYHTTVFLLPPWQAIYHTDRERKQDWQEAVRTAALMEQTYTDYGYRPVTVPTGPVAARADFVLQTLANGG
ncbi:AAA family ATPase [Taibaiella chishuiensis]|uniref:Putative ATPase n=1 Tax=Taibaiella chishuiensis TaxID=1434707 RepID=A0A2P8D7R5_9BACT|nr:AAA family ATPase [Taibaiella chishuiensis]PSK93270.1 putative ATPase [Taibaiella chishuiensis]